MYETMPDSLSFPVGHITPCYLDNLGPGHEEVGGAFDWNAIVGAFGASRQ